jgi:SAM-dependent methyltransferase
MKNVSYSSWFKGNRNEPLSASNMDGSVPFLKLLPPAKKSVLVIGCGDGHEVAWLNEHGFSALGVTASKAEADMGKMKYKAKIFVRDMHDLKGLGQFDTIFAANVLEHSPMPYLALLHWRKHLKKNGWLVLVMPSKEWLSEHYHLSVSTRSQMKDLLYKSGFKLIAGPKMKPLIDYHGGDIYFDLGRRWGFLDGYVSQIISIPKNEFKLDYKSTSGSENFLVRSIKSVLKYPYNLVRCWYGRNIREW